MNILKILRIKPLSMMARIKRYHNAKEAIDIYRKRLQNGGIDIIKNRGTAKVSKPNEIVVVSDKPALEKALNEYIHRDYKIPAQIPNDLFEKMKQIRKSNVLFADKSKIQYESGRIISQLKKLGYNETEIQNCFKYMMKQPIESHITPEGKLIEKVSPQLEGIRYGSTVVDNAPEVAGQGFAVKDSPFVWAPNENALIELSEKVPGKITPKRIKLWQTTLPHEFEHAFQDADKVYQKYYNPKHLVDPYTASEKELKKMSSEMDELIGINPSTKYLTKLTELLARGTQIKNWLGFTNPLRQITPQELKEAAAYMPKDTYDNNLTEFFHSITDWNKAAKFLSYASAATGVAVGLNQTT